MWLFDPDRKLIVEHKFLLGDDRAPAFCALSRLQLHKILLAAVERAGVEIRLGVTVSSINEDEARAQFELATAGQEWFTLMPGSKGFRSPQNWHLVGPPSVP